MDLQEQSTRTAILNFLKINGSSEAKAMAEFCGLTTMAVRKRRSEMMTRYRARVKGKDLEERVCETVSILSECGYMAEAVPSGSREFLLTEHNCAIRDIAKCFPVACEEELCFIRDVVGAKVTRVTPLLAGDRHCSYLIERNKQPHAGARKKKA